MATTSERLKEILAIRQIKQVDLIERTGISKGALSSYLSGRYVPKQDNIYKLANALDVNPAWLMGLDVPMEIPHEYLVELSDQAKNVQDRLLPYGNRLAEIGKQIGKNLQYGVDLQNGLKIEIEKMAQDYEPEQLLRAFKFMEAFLMASSERQKIALEILQQSHQEDS